MSDSKPATRTPRAKPAEAKVQPSRAARTGVQVKKKDLVDSIVTRSGIKKPDVRATLDATLAIIAERLMAGDELVLPPLGRVRLLKERQTPKARIATLRLQQSSDADTATDPLAEAED